MANPKYYETDEFKRLQAEWYRKLEKDGFTDIERPASPYDALEEFRLQKNLKRGALDGVGEVTEILEAEAHHFRWTNRRDRVLYTGYVRDGRVKDRVESHPALAGEGVEKHYSRLQKVRRSAVARLDERTSNASTEEESPDDDE